jgi:hypothetical protein
MSFNKRYYSKKTITENARAYEYGDFKKYMLNPDSFIFMDDESNKIWTEFSNGNEETRKNLYKKIRNEN